MFKKRIYTLLENLSAYFEIVNGIQLHKARQFRCRYMSLMLISLNSENCNRQQCKVNTANTAKHHNTGTLNFICAQYWICFMKGVTVFTITIKNCLLWLFCENPVLSSSHEIDIYICTNHTQPLICYLWWFSRSLRCNQTKWVGS